MVSAWLERTLVVALSVLALRPLLSSQLVMGHDADRYVPRTVEFHESARAGQLPPLWAAHLSAGHGQPLFEFAPPLLYALGEPIYALGLGVPRAIQLPVFALFLAGALAFSDLARRLAGSAAGRVAPIAFLYAPYVQIDLFVRAAWSEALALALAPCMLLAVVVVFERPGLATATGLGVTVAAIALSHPPGFLLAMALGATIALALIPQRHGVRALPAGLAGLAIGLGASAFSWLPAFLERTHTKTYLLTAGDLDYTQHFLEPWQLLSGRWGYAYSVPGPDDGMPFGVGWAHALLACAGLVVALRSPDRRLRAVAIAATVLLLVALLLTLGVAAPVWKRVPLLPYFAYPWRLLALPAVLLPLLASFSVRDLRREYVLVPIALLAAVNLRHAQPWGFRAIEPSEVVPEEIAIQKVKTSYYEEYEPRNAPRDPFYQRHLLESKDPRARGRLLAHTPERSEFEIDAPARANFVLRTYNFPGWTVSVDGREVPAWTEALTGRIAFDAGPGRRRVTVELRATPVRRVAALLSLATVLAVTAVALARLRAGARARVEGAPP